MRNRRILLYIGLNYYVFVISDVILIGIGHFLVDKIMSIYISLGMNEDDINTDIYRKSEIIQII